jgi:hypothetical protein
MATQFNSPISNHNPDHWLMSSLGIVGVAVIAAIVAAFIGRPYNRSFEIVAALLAAVGAIGVNLVFNYLYNRSHNVGSAVGFLSVIFVTVGLATVVVATEKWPVAALAAGACLLGGSFIGLLFGLPIQMKAESAKEAATRGPAASGQTLIAQTADTLSKFLTGAVIVRYPDIRKEFNEIVTYLGSCTRCCDWDSTGSAFNNSFAAALILYFTAVGFLIGLLLPRYYKVWPGANGASSGTSVPGSISPSADAT